MKVVAIVQARIASTRLPGKVLRELEGRPMIEHVLERAGAIEGVDEVCLATTDSSVDDPLVDLVERAGRATVFRGSEDDVLSRYAAAARVTRADVVVRVTADCPLLSPDVSSTVVRALLDDPACDYASNTLKRTYPRGLDTEVFAVGALEDAHRNADDPWEREHVTPYLYLNPKRFKLRQVVDREDHSSHRWTVDTPEDFELVRRIYGELWREDVPFFEYADVLACLASHPDWVSINQHVAQKQR
jgi:spore coat polysaccharide biosynthesis protein SpsF